MEKPRAASPGSVPFPTTTHSRQQCPNSLFVFPNLFRALGDSQERRYGAISPCHRVSMRVWVRSHPPPTPVPTSLGEPLPLTSLLQGELGEMGLDGIDGEEVSRFNYVPLYRELFCWQGPGSGKHSSKSFVILQGDKGLPGSSGEKGSSGRRVGFHHIYSHKGLKGGWKAPEGWGDVASEMSWASGATR